MPNYLRDAPKRFVPRFGFAYRPFGDKTVFRGGFGVFNTEVLGSIYYALTGTLQSNTRTYNNINSQGQPIFEWPQTQLAGLGAIAPVRQCIFRHRESGELERSLRHAVGLFDRPRSRESDRTAAYPTSG